MPVQPTQEQRPAADTLLPSPRSSMRVAVLFFLFLNCIYLLTSTGRVRTIDEIDPVVQSESLLLRHSTAIPQAMNSGIYFGKLDQHGVPRSAWPVGHSLLVLPWSAAGHYLLARLPGIPRDISDLAFEAAACWSSATFAALAVAAFFLLFLKVGISQRRAMACSLLLAFSTPLFVYSGWLYSEPATIAIFVIAALLLFGYGKARCAFAGVAGSPAARILHSGAPRQYGNRLRFHRRRAGARPRAGRQGIPLPHRCRGGGRRRDQRSDLPRPQLRILRQPPRLWRAGHGGKRQGPQFLAQPGLAGCFRLSVLSRQIGIPVLSSDHSGDSRPAPSLAAESRTHRGRCRSAAGQPHFLFLPHPMGGRLLLRPALPGPQRTAALYSDRRVVSGFASMVPAAVLDHGRHRLSRPGDWPVDQPSGRYGARTATSLETGITG